MAGDRSPASSDAAGDASGASEPASLIDRIAMELDLLVRNVDIVEQLSGKRPMGIIRLSETLHLPIHKVRYSLHLLEREGVIQPSADGAIVTDRAREFWRQMDAALDRMSEQLRHLKERTAGHQDATSANRKGY